jgi:hypothetical protein
MPNKTNETNEKPKLKLTGKNGNAFVLLGAAQACARKHGIDFAPIQKEAMSGDYDHLLMTLCKYFDVH